MNLKKSKNKTICILSGGLDSTTLLYQLVKTRKDVKAISFYYGQRHKIELANAQRTCKKLGIDHKIINITCLKELINNSALTGNIEVPEGHYESENMKLTVVPNRNMIFASIAIAWAVNIGFDEIALGIHSGDHAIYPDCRPKFISELRAIAKSSNEKSIKVYTPFLHKDKVGILREGLKIGVDYLLTRTCYNNEEKACGKCGSCYERLASFAALKIKDPIQYK